MLATGRFADRRAAVPVGLALFALAGALPALAHSPWVLFALLLVVGATSGGLDVAINARASAIESVRRVRVMDGLHAAFSAGVLVGGVSGGLLRRAGAHPEWILVGVAAIVLVTGAISARDDVQSELAGPRAHAGARLVGVGAVLAFAFVLEGGLESWSAVFLERGLGTSPAISGLGPGAFAAAMTTGRLSAQRVARVSPQSRILGAGLLAAAGIGLAAAAHRPAVALVGFVLAGIGLSVAAPTLLGAAGRLGGGAAISTVATVGYVGFLAGAPLFGGVAGLSGLRGGFVALAGIAAALGGASFLLPRLLRDSSI